MEGDVGKRPPERAGRLEVRREVVVQQAPPEAFELFTEGLADWWPLETHALSADAIHCGMECRVGGRVFEIDGQGERTDWGTLTVWEPHRRLCIEWDRPGAPHQTVDVRFLEHPRGTRVVLSSVPQSAGVGEAAPDLADAARERGPGKQVEALVRQAGDLIDRGELRSALSLARDARRVALQSEQGALQRSADRTRCSAILVAGRARWVLRTLKRQLDDRLEPSESMRVHYQLALAYELLKQPRKARFYSQAALLLARDQGDAYWLIACLNQQGNTLLAGGEAKEAEEVYEEALELLDPSHVAERLQIECNLGYCALLRDDPRAAVHTLRKSLSGWRALGNERQEILPRLDLTQAYLALGRFGKAVRQGRAAYELARRYRDSEQVTRALFLLGECGTGLEDEELARDSRDGLQHDELLESFRHLIDTGIPLGFNEAINWRA